MEGVHMATDSKPKSRLGRGLASLISLSDLPAEAEIPPQVAQPTSATTAPPGPAAERITPLPAAAVGPYDIPVEAIEPNPHQPRKQFDEAGILALAASIKSSGLVQPVVVRKVGPGRYQLIAGERRLRATKAAGLPKILAIIRDADPFKQAQMALVENIQREDLNAIDRAEAYQALMRHLGLTQSELATRLGEERTSIAHYLRLLELPQTVQDYLKAGELTMGHAKLLNTLTDPQQQEQLATTVVSQGLSVRNLERVLEMAAIAQPKATSDKEPPSAHIVDLEKTITSQLGLRVQLRASSSRKGRGKLIIHYTDLDQFDRLLERLGVKND
jgi:ParB family chromosome partitioning protein